jgi:polysulfide reductase chain C
VSYRILRRPGDSWIARGFFILSGFIGSGLALILFWIGPWPLIRAGSILWNVLGFTAGVFAFLTSIYPAFLLGSSPIPLWNTPILPVLFLASSASMGTAAMVLWAVGIPGFHSQTLSFLVETEALLIVSELFLLFLYFHGMKLSETGKRSVRKILAERFALLFWGGVVGIGLVLPVVLEAAGGSTVLPALSVLIGGYLLRYVIVLAGIKPPLSVQGVILPIPDRN